MWRSWSKAAFVKAAQHLIPEIRSEAARPGSRRSAGDGDRPSGDMVDDFVIQASGRIVNVLNAPSPAAASSLNMRQAGDGEVGGAAGLALDRRAKARHNRSMSIATETPIVWDAVRLAERFGPIPLNRICTDLLRVWEPKRRSASTTLKIVCSNWWMAYWWRRRGAAYESMLAMEIGRQLAFCQAPKPGTVLGSRRPSPAAADGAVHVAFLSMENFPRAAFLGENARSRLISRSKFSAKATPARK
jgi:hypothetical protein